VFVCFPFISLKCWNVAVSVLLPDTVICSGDLSAMPSTGTQVVIPVVIAACLAATVIVIVIGYAIQRYVSRHLRQSDYKQMD
jgi:ABC-type glycerol-3-phosphate transport system permease component